MSVLFLRRKAIQLCLNKLFANLPFNMANLVLKTEILKKIANSYQLPRSFK